MKDLELTRLETKEECLIGDVFRAFVTKNYIIDSTSMEGIYHFKKDGAFVRKVANRGRGPGEIIGSYLPGYNENEQTLYVKTEYNSEELIQAYKLPEAEFSSIRINTYARVNDMIVRDSVITIAPLPFEDDCRVISQTLSGRELFRINHTNENNDYTANIFDIDGQMMFSYSHGGNTVYLINDGERVTNSIYSVKGKMIPR